jgi:hypothetical protein
MNVGVVFASTGGEKMARALRTFRKAEPDLTVHITMDMSTNTWKGYGQNPPMEWFVQQPNVKVLPITNTGYVNGGLNKAVRWIKDLGFTHCCLMQDDLVFSTLPENRYHISVWFEEMFHNPQLQSACGLTFSCMEALVPSKIEGHWQRDPQDWDRMDLESEKFWQILLPGGKPVGYFGDATTPIGETHFPDDPSWFVHYYGTDRVGRFSRLGPSGQILPIANFDLVGGFDETYGIFYDLEFPIACALKGLDPILILPNVPYLHLHNQSQIADPAIGLWENTLASFERKYGKPLGELGKEVGY